MGHFGICAFPRKSPAQVEKRTSAMGGKDDEPQPLTPVTGDYAPPYEPKRQGFWSRYGWPLLSLFLLLNVIVLYILHFVDDGGSSSSAVQTTFTTSTLSSEQSGGSSEASKGQAVSFDADGKLTVGAGTTAYLAAATLPSEDEYIAWIQFAKLGTSEAAYATNLVSYQIGATETSAILTTFTVDASAKTVTLAEASSGNTIQGAAIKALETLSDSRAIALSSVTSADGLSYTISVTPVAIADGAATLDQDHTTFAINNSATNFVARLSDSQFAVAYYEPYTTEGYYQRLIVGSVADDSSVSFSDSVEFGQVNGALLTTFGTPKAVSSASTTFAVPWFVDDSTATKDNATIAGSVGLCLYTAKITANEISKTDETCDSTVEPAYYIDSERLEDNVLGLIFFDRSNNFALTVLIAEYSSITGIPTFRGSFVIEEASGAFDFGSAYGFYPTPTIRSLPNNRLAISFLNPANSGKPSVKVLKYAADYSIQEVSPVLPVSNEDFSVSSADPKAYGSIVLDALPVSSGFVVSYAGLWAGAQNQRIALVESLGKPVGVVSDAGSDLKVAMSGAVELDSDYTSGTSYYASTSGTLYGAATTTADNYILAGDNSIVISKDALVGVAVSDSKIVVTV